MASVLDFPTAAERSATHFPPDWTLADVQMHLGGVPAERIRLHPFPGVATEQDLLALEDRGIKLIELIDGILVEKAVGWEEAIVTMLIGQALRNYLDEHDLGHVLGPDAIVRLLPNRLRAADVAFVGWHRFPKDRLPRRPIPRLIPDLAIEVLSETNTEAEMQLKLKDYFDAGVPLVWIIDPATRSARVYTALDQMETIGTDGKLDGGEVLPGFELRLDELFERAERQGPAS
jgi:Uma2 family endonuclease